MYIFVWKKRMTMPIQNSIYSFYFAQSMSVIDSLLIYQHCKPVQDAIYHLWKHEIRPHASTFSISYSIRNTSPFAIKGRCFPLGKIKACFLLINNRSHSPSVITSMGPFFGKSAAFSSKSIPG
jgi:hypothetical protein